MLSACVAQHWHLPMETAVFVPSLVNTSLFLVNPFCTNGENNAGMNTESKNSFCLTRDMHLERSFFPPFREHPNWWLLRSLEAASDKKKITCISCYWDVPCQTLPTKIRVLLILLAWEMVARGRLGYPYPCQPWFIVDNFLGWWKPRFVAGRCFSIPCVQAGTTRQRQLQKQSWRAELWLCFSLWCQAQLKCSWYLVALTVQLLQVTTNRKALWLIQIWQSASYKPRVSLSRLSVLLLHFISFFILVLYQKYKEQLSCCSSTFKEIIQTS